MTDASERERIRERKRERLRNRVEGGAGGDGATGVDGGGANAPADAPDEPIHVDGAGHFEELTDRYGVVLADFYADWCGPCGAIEPIVERIAAETDAAVAKVDVDAHQGLAGRLGIRGVPTLILYADGEQVEQLVGMQDESKLRGLVERYA